MNILKERAIARGEPCGQGTAYDASFYRVIIAEESEEFDTYYVSLEHF